MPRNIPSNAIKDIAELYKNDDSVQKFIDSMAKRKKNFKNNCCDINQIGQFGISKEQARDLFSKLHKFGWGSKRNRTADMPARFEFLPNCNPRILAQDVLRHVRKIENHDQEKMPKENRVKEEWANIIDQIKEDLANKINISASNVEIVIRL